MTLTVDGSTDGTAKKTDLTFSVAAGPLAFNGAVRQIGDQAWLQLNGKWYTLPADALSSSSGGSGTTTTGGTSKIDAQQIIAAFGKPGSIVKDAKLDGTEDVGGVKSDHITGTVDIAALVKGLTSAMSSVGSTSTPISPADLQSSVTQLQQYIKGATVRRLRRPVRPLRAQAGHQDRRLDPVRPAGRLGHQRLRRCRSTCRAVRRGLAERQRA